MLPRGPREPYPVLRQQAQERAGQGLVAVEGAVVGPDAGRRHGRASAGPLAGRGGLQAERAGPGESGRPRQEAREARHHSPFPANGAGADPEAEAARANHFRPAGSNHGNAPQHHETDRPAFGHIYL